MEVAILILYSRANTKGIDKMSIKIDRLLDDQVRSNLLSQQRVRRLLDNVPDGAGDGQVRDGLRQSSRGSRR